MLKPNIKILLAALLIICLVGGMFLYESSENENDLPETSLTQIPEIQARQSLQIPEPVTDESDNEMEFRNDAFLFKIRKDSSSYILTAYENSKKIAQSSLKGINRIISAQVTDLNGNGSPEILIFLNAGKGMEFTGYELRQNQLIPFNLPKLIGRPSFGYAGEDTLFLRGNKIVRQFQFRNAEFTSFPSGTRTCEYSLGYNLKFAMQKSIDSE